MTNELPLKAIIGAVSLEKGVSEDVIFEALEAALVSATKKKAGLSTAKVSIAIDKKTGRYETTRHWDVVADDVTTVLVDDEEVELDKEIYLHLSDALKLDKNAAVNTVVDESIQSVEFGRIAAQTAKQVIMQKVQEAERALVAQEYEKRIGQIVSGVVKKVTRDFVIIDVANNVDGILRRDQMIPRESFRVRDKIRAYLVAVSPERGPQLILSRTCNEMLLELFKLEVPEVDEGVIEIRAVARDPGSRAKIAVKTNDGRIDPVGACVGMRGSRVQAVSGELGGERVDIVLWDGEPAQFVMNAMAPAEIVSIAVDEETNTMDIAVADESLSQAIGRSGQNVKLASKVTGWILNVMSANEASEVTEAEQEKIKAMFVNSLNVDQDIAEILVAAGFTSLEEVAYVPQQELLAIEEFDEEIVAELRNQAKDALVTQALTEESSDSNAEDDLSLKTLSGMNDELLAQLTSNNINERDDLAECSVEELLTIAPTLSEDQAKELIIASKAHWFADEK